MGGCAIPTQKSIGVEFRGDLEPEDTNSLRGITLPQRIFNVKISNIKLKNIPYDYVSLSLTVSNFPQIKLEKRKVDEGVVRVYDWLFQWNDKPQKLQLKCNQYQLRKQWITVQMFYMEVKMAEIKLNLYRIASGPAHLTFPLKFSSKSEGRLSMDVHFSQWINIYIQTNYAQVLLEKSRPQQLFNFTIRAITRSEKDEEQSQPSYPQKQVQLQIEGKDRKSNAQDDNKLIWKNSVSKCLPKMQRKLNSTQLAHSSIQFMLWECNDIEIQEDDVLTGECYISLNKGNHHDPVESTKFGRPTLVYKVNVNQKLWLSGKCIGIAKIQMMIEIDQYIKQNLLLVRTQNGLQLSTPIFDTTKQRVQCPQIIEIGKLQKLIEQGLNRMQSFKRTDTLKIQDVRIKVIGNMQKLLALIESSKKESMKFYIYKSQKDLLNGQEELLNIGIKMLSRLDDESNLMLKQHCWKILIALIQRGELSLRYTGFNLEEKENVSENNISKLLKQKLQFSIKYQQFLYNALKSALQSMESKNLSAIQRKFVEFYCAFCYLRIPQFREELLEAVSHKNDPIIEEWRGIEFDLEDEGDIEFRRKNDPQLSYMYDWQTNFYNVIIVDPRSKQNIHQLKQTLSINEWRQRMEKRGVAFFLFVGYWVEYIQIAAIISQNVKWHILPGYNRLIKAIFSQLKKRNIIQYPDSLKQLTTKMLANQKLLNVFVTIILKRMNLMQYTSVIAGLQMISGYFKYLSQNKRKIPTTFNYSNFLTSLKNIITHEHSFSAAVCLKLIYDHYNMFAPEFRREMSLFLLGKIFFRLFLSWSFNIRVVFHHLLLFRLVLLANKVPVEKRALEHGINSEVKKKYLILMNIVQNIKVKKQQDQCDNFRINYQKQYYKKMKKKLQEGRKINNMTSNIIDRNIKRKNTLKQTKYSVKQLSRPTETLRAHSQVIENVHINYNRGQVNDDTYSYMQDYSEQSSQTEQQLKIRKKIQPQNEISDLPMELLEYTKEALAEFRDVEQKFDKFYSGNIDTNIVPALSIKIPTDEGQFRTIYKQDW